MQMKATGQFFSGGISLLGVRTRNLPGGSGLNGLLSH